MTITLVAVYAPIGFSTGLTGSLFCRAVHVDLEVVDLAAQSQSLQGPGHGVQLIRDRDSDELIGEKTVDYRRALDGPIRSDLEGLSQARDDRLTVNRSEPPVATSNRSSSAALEQPASRISEKTERAGRNFLDIGPSYRGPVRAQSR